MGAGHSLPYDKRIVIVGGGFAGVSLANELLKVGANFRFIDPKNVFHLNIGAVRSIVEADFSNKICIPYLPRFAGHFIKGTVRSVDPPTKTVILETGEGVEYDYLVLATGTSAPFPYKTQHDQDRIVEMCERIRSDLRASDHVVLVGGGSTGLEMAGELATDMPDLRVTMVTSNDELGNLDPLCTQKSRERLREMVNSLNVQVITGEKVENLNDIRENRIANWNLILSSGRVLEADMVLNCTGTWVNSAGYADGIGKKGIHPDGSLRVNDHLQVMGYSDILAMGDCAHLGEAKLAHLAWKHGPFIHRQLHNLIHNKPLEIYKPNDGLLCMFLSVGRNYGLAQFKNGLNMPEWLAKWLKSKDCGIWLYWRNLDQIVPYQPTTRTYYQI